MLATIQAQSESGLVLLELDHDRVHVDELLLVVAARGGEDLVVEYAHEAVVVLHERRQRLLHKDTAYFIFEWIILNETSNV